MMSLNRPWCVLAVGVAFSPEDAWADPPAALTVRATVTVQDGVVWFRPGDLLVGTPSLPGRPAVRPLAPEQAAALPVHQGDFEDLGAGCSVPGQELVGAAPVVLTRGDLGGDGQLEVVTVQRAMTAAAPELRVLRGDQPVAVGHLPVPAQPCRGLVAEALPEGAPELLVVWTSRGAEGVSVGVTVFALP